MILSVVTPCFNEQESIEAFSVRLREVLDGMGVDYEVIFVDDGSTDKTSNVLGSISWPEKRVLTLTTNVGHQNALEAGYLSSVGDYVVTLDSDLQHPPELIPVMVNSAISEGVDVVYAARKTRSEEGFLKRTSAELYYKFFRWLVGAKIQPSAADFRLVSRATVNLLASFAPGGKVFRLLIPRLGLPSSTVHYVAAKRFAGKTKYNSSQMLRLFIHSVISSSTRPLFLAAQFSIFFAFLAMVNLGYVFYAFATGLTVPGWASVSSAVLILFSVNFFVLGIFGAYLARLVTSAASNNLERAVIERSLEDD